MEVRVCVKHPYFITHYYHSGFSVAGEHTLLVFDYWRGEHGELAPDRQITPEKLKQAGAGESVLREIFPPNASFRLRVHGDLARIEAERRLHSRHSICRFSCSICPS